MKLYNEFGLRFLPRLNPVRKTFGLRWHGYFPPSSWVINTLAAVAGALIVLLLMDMLAVSDESALAAAKAHQAELVALHQQAIAEQHLIHLLNGGTLIADTDFVSCKLRDRASTKL